MSSNNSLSKSIRSHSIHVAIERDYRRIRLLQKQDIKQEKEFIKLQRKLSVHSKWNERADNKNSINDKTNQRRPSMTLEEFMEREKLKHNNMINSKKMANERIRPN